MSRPTWVLLRGLARESGHWGDFVGLLAERMRPERVVTVDLPGTGVHHAGRSPVSIAAMVDACRADLRQRGHGPPYRLLGLSLGGMVALDWVDRFADEVGSCVVLNTSARSLGAVHERLRPRQWLALLRALLAGDARHAETLVLRCTSSDPGSHARVLAEWTRLRERRPVSHANAARQLWAAARHVLPDAPPRVPVLVLCSAGDALVDPACSRRLAARWQVAQAEHPSAGHDLALDAAGWVVDQVEAFVRGAP